MSRKTVVVLSIVAAVGLAGVLWARPLALRLLQAAIPKIQAAIEERYGVSVKAEDITVRWDWVWPEFEFKQLVARKPDGSSELRVDRATARVSLEGTIRTRSLTVSLLSLHALSGHLSLEVGKRIPLQWDRVEVAPSGGHYRFNATSPGVVVEGTVSEPPIRAEVRLAEGKIPAVLEKLPPGLLPQSTETWLRSALSAGTLAGASFSWAQGQSRFQGSLQGVSLKFDSKWPALEQAEGTIEVMVGPEASHLKANLTRARYSGAELVDCIGEIPDLDRTGTSLQLGCGLRGTGAVIREFLDRGPVATTTRPVLELINPGEARDMQLSLNIPIDSKGSVSGEIVLKDADLEVVKPKLVATRVRGAIRFSAATLSLQGIEATVFGHPWKVDGELLGPKAVVRVAGVVPVERLAETVGLPSLSRWVSGELPGKAEIHLRPLRLKLEATLQSVQLRIPSPVGELGGTEAGVRAEVALMGEQPQSMSAEIFNSDQVTARVAWSSKNHELRGDGSLPLIAIEPWQKFLEEVAAGTPKTASAGPSLTSDVKIQARKISWRDLEFSDVAVQFKNSAKEAKVSVRSLDLLGEATFAVPFASGTTIGRFERILLPHWPRSAEVPMSEEERLRTAWKLAEIPPLDLVVQRLRVGEQLYGRAEVVAIKPNWALMKIERLKVDGPELQISGSGEWNSERTSVDLAWKIRGTTFPTRFESLSGVELRDTDLRTAWSWEGGPDQFGLKRLSGALDGSAREGVFLGVSSGAVSMFNFLSFSGEDTAAKKLRFYKAKIALKFKDGTIEASPFSALMGSVFTKLTGKAYAHTEKLALEARVTPSVEDLPADGTEPGNLLSHTYKVGGSWTSPEVSLKVF